VKDRVFSGVDVEAALAGAAASLGLPQAELRYVVLETGVAGGRGLKPTPARIAVLIQDPAASAPPRGGREQPPSTPAPTGDPGEVPALVRDVVRAVAETGGIAVECEIDDGESALLVHLVGEGSAFFHGEDGKGAPLRALEHLLQRMYGEVLRPRALRVQCEGYRERRDQALTEDAQRLAGEVRADGQARELEPMSSYDRRIVHLALQDAPDVTTYSVGEGAERRVRIALADAGHADTP